MDNLESHVIEYLKIFSVFAEKIAESDTKTPDFLVQQEERILIELKEKVDQAELYELKEAKFASGEVYEYSSSMEYSNRISGIIRSGIEQLDAQRIKTKSDFCLLFMVANGVAPRNQIEKIISTLYGRKSVIDFKSNSNQAVHCYYAYYSEFFKHRNILDGVILVADGVTYLLINNLSPRYNAFKASHFYSKFDAKVMILDPIDLEMRGEIMIADCDIPRKNTKLVKEYIFSKYGIEEGLMLDFPQYILQAGLK